MLSNHRQSKKHCKLMESQVQNIEETIIKDYSRNQKILNHAIE